MQAPRGYVERYPDEKDPRRRVYLGMIAALDDAVGQVLAALDRAGVADDTLVFFLSDNGAATYTGIATNTPLRGGKLMNFEGGINVPFLLRWPKHAPAGATYHEPVSALDIFATVASAAGAALPADRPYDGVDLLPHVRGERQAPPHDALYWRAAGHRAIRAGRYKLISDARTGSRVLYDEVADPFEDHDLAEAEKARADALEQQLRAWEASLMAPRWPSVMEYRYTEAGRPFVFPL
jgi:arylsulfatase A-like enzyme